MHVLRQKRVGAVLGARRSGCRWPATAGRARNSTRQIRIRRYDATAAVRTISRMLRLVPSPSRLKRILVVDDDSGIRSLIELHLRNEGYDVILAEDAMAATRALLRRAPDLLLVDIHMPYWNGLDFVTTLMADPTMPFMPVIFMTGDERRAERAEALGARCLVKPFFRDMLIAMVRERLDAVPAVHCAAVREPTYGVAAA